MCISNKIKLFSFNVKLGSVLNYEFLKNDMKKFTETLDISQESFYRDSRIESARACYRGLKVDPTRYRISVDSLYRRIFKGKGLYYVNPVVDCCNLISLKSLFSVGVYQKDALSGKIMLRLGNKDDSYEGIGRGSLNIDNIPVLCDDISPFGSATSDSVRTMVKRDSGEFMINVFTFSETEIDIEEVLISTLKEYFTSVELTPLNINRSII